MDGDTEAQGPLKYTVQVTEEDVRGLEAFLTPRLQAVKQRHPADSDEARSAQSVLMNFREEAEGLVEAVARLEMVAHRDGWEKHQCEQRIIDGWSGLVYLAEPWAETSGYNTDRWKIPNFGTPEAEVLFLDRTQP